MSKIELVQIDENNYYIGKSKIEFIENKIIHVIPVGEMTYEIAKLHETIHNKLIQLAADKVYYLANVSKIGKLAPKTLKPYKGMAFHNKVDKIAVYGVNPVTRVVVAFVLGLTPKNNHRLFDTKEQAISWLKE